MAPNLRFSLTPKSRLDMPVDGSLSDEEEEEEECTELYLHHRRHTASPRRPPSSDMPLSLSHNSWLTRRSSHTTNTTNATPTNAHTSTSKIKDEVHSLGYADSNPSDFECKYGHNADDAGFKSPPSATIYNSSSHSVPLRPHFQQHSSSTSSRHRTSLLSVASDALGFRRKIGSVSRKKSNFHSLPHTSNIMPGVIEINAHNNATAHTDYEHEERERLRDVAAQSIGLDPKLLHHPCKSQSRSPLDSSQSLPQPARIPSFPATLAALRPLTNLSATLPKFTPSSSLLVYALAKQWKPRTIVLTSHSVSQKTHVHLFKGASKDEKEVERLEITEDSLIFVAEEEVRGRGHVVKLAGKDVSAKQHGAVGEESLRTMWFLQIADPAESQRWITAIKNVVLARRAVRAGLDIPTRTDGGNEPKGDMDIMLSMHLQGIISTHPTKPSTTISPPSPPMPTSPSPPPSLRSLRINIPSPSPTITTKGIFSGTRPRSPSVEGSPTLPYPPGHAEDSFGGAGTSLLTMLRTKSSADSTSSPSHSLLLPLPHVPGQESPASSLQLAKGPVVIAASDLKISKERDAPELSIVVPKSSSSIPLSLNTPSTPSLSHQSTLTLSLQPPPRKCKHAATTIPATFLPEQQGMYKQASGNRSVAGNFGIPSRGSGDITPREASLVSLAPSSLSGGQPGSFSLNSGFEAACTIAGEAHGNEQSDDVTPIPYASSPGSRSVVSADTLLQSTSITKRWSHQGVPLPKQLIPPSGPLPFIPPSPENKYRTSVESSISTLATYTGDRSPRSSSSYSPSQARISLRSGASLSPTFWKRVSSTSTYSASSTGTSDSRGGSQRPVHFPDGSFPSSLGSVVGSGASSSRPMSMSVLASLPVAHIGKAKRRSMPPPRPAPKFAPPPAPTVQDSTSGPVLFAMPAPGPQKCFRSSVAHRATRLSLTSPKPPPSSALPPRPDEAAFVHGHRRSSSADTSDLPIPLPSSRPTSALSGNCNPIQPTSHPRSLSIRKRLRILSTPPASFSPVESSSSLPSIQVSTLDLSDDNDDPPTPYLQSPQPFGLGEHIMMIQDDPSFLQLSDPVPTPPPRSPFRPMPSSSRMSGLRIPPPESDRNFIALSPPPRRGSKPHIATVTRPEKCEIEVSGSAEREDHKLAALSQRGSVVSLGFVTT